MGSRHPKGLAFLTIAECLERLSFYGTHALLVLYLVSVFSFADSTAYAFFGTYTALSYMMLILGGIIADWLIGMKKAIIFGTLGIIVGNVLLAGPGPLCLYFGLALTVMGIGLFKGNITSLVGFLYESNSHQREIGYTLFYVGMNTGAALGPLLYGILAQQLGWNYGFILSAILMTIVLLTLMKHKTLLVALDKKIFLPKDRLLNKKRFLHFKIESFFYLILLCLTFFIALLFKHPHISNLALAGTLSIAIIITMMVVIVSGKAYRNKLIAILLLTIFSIFFFASIQQLHSSVTLFLERYTEWQIFGWKIPTLLFSSLLPVLIILLAPFCIMLWHFLDKHHLEPSIPLKLVLGLLFAAISFVFFALMALYSNSLEHWQSLTLLIAGNLLLAFGEIFIFPTITSAVSEYAPAHLVGMMMGLWFLSSALAGYVASAMADIGVKITTTIQPFAYTYTVIAIIMLIMAILTLLCTPWIKRLLNINADLDVL